MAAAAATADAKAADFYGVLGLQKECTARELRIAYKRLALRWHPDRCSGSTRSAEEAKKKFQDIQEAYSVLSDTNKRFLYDVGVYENDDDVDDNMQDMGDFLSEMAAMISQTKPNGDESFEQLQDLFNEMFQDDINTSPPFNLNSTSTSSAFCSSSSFNNYGYGDGSSSTNKRPSTDMGFANGDSSSFDTQFQTFCVGSGGTSSSSSRDGDRIKRRN